MNLFWSLICSSFWRRSAQVTSDSIDMIDEGIAMLEECGEENWWGAGESEGSVVVAAVHEFLHS
jgi:hypothetical protein